MEKITLLPYAFTNFERSLIIAFACIFIAASFYRPKEKNYFWKETVQSNHSLIIFNDTLVKYPLNINTAPMDILELVPEIGKKTAIRIDSLRKKAPIRDIRQLLFIPGINERKLERIRYYITVNDSI
ncbi:MAG: helix-hairpin-helix domain-containing protein [bacterium]|nr:helix-hairpin-helix domain-containing protein [bacterium]